MNSLLLMPADAAPNVFEDIRPIVDWHAERHAFTVDMALLGGQSIDLTGVPITPDAIAKAQQASAVIVGPTREQDGGSRPAGMRPGDGIMKMRPALELFANVRPAFLDEPFVSESSLRPDLARGLDIVIVRELLGGLYMGQPAGLSQVGDERVGINTLRYTSSEVRRVARVAFSVARERSGRVCSVHKGNVLVTSQMWREEVRSLQESEYPEIELTDMLVDHTAHELVRNPRQFDVILADNMFGDLLSDEAAGLTGFAQLLPSASLSHVGPNGRAVGMYEQMHLAETVDDAVKENPIGTLRAFAMALRHSLGCADAATALEAAIGDCLRRGMRTADLPATQGDVRVSGRQFCDGVLERLSAAS